jgi:pyridoxamine 5'-phosphate oxidase
MENTKEESGLDFSEADLTESPFELFATWFGIAKARSGLNDPNAMCLSTIDEDGSPDSRMVLLKQQDERGFVFFTNSLSNKGRSLTKTPKASLNFFWDSLRRQIRIQGRVEKVSDQESDNYFASRSRISQLGAWASSQSQRLESRKVFEDRIENYKLNFPEQVPRPPHWYGFRVVPSKIEFWQDRRDRLHDRFEYKSVGGVWSVSRLYP